MNLMFADSTLNVIPRVEVRPTGIRDGDPILSTRSETSACRMTTAKQPTTRARCEI